ncbi:ABC transporter permease [Lacrimispora brassicae]
MKEKLMPYLLLAPQILLSILFMIGLITGITQSLGVIPAFGLKKPTFFYYKEILSRPDMLQSVVYSLRIALISAVLATVGGVFFCGVCVMGKKTRGVVVRIIQLPIIVPHVVTALFMINIFSRNGILARVAYALGMIQEQRQFPMLIYDPHGVGIIMAYLWKEIPFIIYFVIALMANINGSLGEAATNLGAKRWTVFLRVTLPLCRNTIISGFLIIFVFALGAYELPLLLGATIPKALPVLAYQEYIHPDLRNRPYAMALNGIIIVISLMSALVYCLMMKKVERKNVKYLTDEE